MEKSLCFYFQVHQPDRLRLYRFFDIGNDSNYFDDFANRTILNRVAQRCYLPMNAILLELVKKYKGKFKVAFSISGVALEQFEKYNPAVLDSFNLAWNPADQTVSRLEEGKRRNLPPSTFPSFPPSLIQAKLRCGIPRGS